MASAKPKFEAATGRPSPDRDDLHVARDGDREPRLPHERDQSSDSQTAGHDRETGRRASRDVQSGMLDTGRAPVVEELARKHFPPRIEKPE